MRLIPLDELPHRMHDIVEILDRFVLGGPGNDYAKALNEVMTGRTRMWDLDGKGLIATEVDFRPGPVLFVPWLWAPNAGDAIDDSVYNGLVDHAREIGCLAVEFVFRPGFARSKWARKFDKIQHVGDVCRVDLGEVA